MKYVVTCITLLVAFVHCPLYCLAQENHPVQENADLKMQSWAADSTGYPRFQYESSQGEMDLPGPAQKIVAANPPSRRSGMQIQSLVLPALSPFLTKTLGKITAVLDTLNGRFSVYSGDGKTVLWYGTSTLTSHISVKIGNRYYSNYLWAILGRDTRMTFLGKGKPEVLADRLRYTWILHTSDGEYLLMEELIPESTNDWNEVRVRIAVENRTNVTTSIGIAAQMDVNADGNDGALVGCEGVWSNRETVYQGGEIPTTWMLGSKAYTPDSAGGRMKGDGVTTPDFFLAGQWESHGALGTALYGYSGSVGRKIWDAAVFAQWDEKDIASGNVREEATAIGLKTTSIVEERPTSFGKRFILPFTGVLYLASDSTTPVHIRYQVDNMMESSAQLDGKWDTTVVVQANKPDTLRLYPPRGRPLNPNIIDDSVTYFRHRVFLIEAEKPIGVVGRWEAGGNDVRLCWPVEQSDTAFLMHGDMGTGENILTTLDRETTIRLTPRKTDAYIHMLKPAAQGELIVPPDTPIEIKLPSRSSVFFRFSNRNRRGFYPFPNMPPDGAGSSLVADNPIQVFRFDNSALMSQTALFDGGLGILLDFIPTRKQRGTEYVYIPYKKTKAIRNEDYVRILAYEDNTSVSLYDNTVPLLLNRAEIIDTLLERPCIIRSNNPVVVTQHPTNYTYANKPHDFCENSGTSTLLPATYWGRTYFGFAGMSNMRPGWGCPDNFERRFYVRIIARTSECYSISLDGNPLDSQTFSTVGDYSYSDIDRNAGPFIVASPHPCFVLTYGWSLRTCGFLPLSDAEAYIPVFK